MPQKQKTVNYDDATVEKMTVIYEGAIANHPDISDPDEARVEAMKEIQAFTGKTMPSIRSKLGNMGIYIKKAEVAKKGGKRTTKSELVSQLADGATERDGFFDSVEGARTDVIEYFLNLQERVSELDATLALDGVSDAVNEALDALENAEASE